MATAMISKFMKSIDTWLDGGDQYATASIQRNDDYHDIFIWAKEAVSKTKKTAITMSIPVSDDDSSTSSGSDNDDDDTILGEQLEYQEDPVVAKGSQGGLFSSTKKKRVTFLPDKIQLRVDTYPNKKVFESLVLNKLKHYHPSLNKLHVVRRSAATLAADDAHDHQVDIKNKRTRTVDEMKSFFKIIQKHHKGLSELELWNVDDVNTTHATTNMICDTLLNLPQLQTLRMNLVVNGRRFCGTKFAQIQVNKVLQTISKMPKLRILTLHVNDTIALSKIIHYSKTLEQIVIVRHDPTSSTKNLGIVKTKSCSDSSNSNGDSSSSNDDGVITKSKIGNDNEIVVDNEYSMGHAMGIIQSIKQQISPLKSSLRVLDLGDGINLSTFCVKLLAGVMVDNKSLTHLMFHYNPQHNSSKNDSDSNKTTTKARKHNHRYRSPLWYGANKKVGASTTTTSTISGSSSNSSSVREIQLEQDHQLRRYAVNNRLLQEFIKVLDTNNTLEIIKNHGHAHVHGITEENTQYLIQSINENPAIRQFQFHHVDCEDEDQGGNGLLALACGDTWCGSIM